jgi:hypothetical protein
MTQAEMVSPNPPYWLVVSGKFSSQISQVRERRVQLSGDSLSEEFSNW